MKIILFQQNAQISLYPLFATEFISYNNPEVNRKIPLCDRFDGDCVENNPEAVVDKSKPWSRSIEDLHGGSTMPSPVTGNGITRAGRHSTLRYDAQTY